MKYPIGQQDFVYLREKDFLYIDKTDLIYSLVNDYKYVFLARPRRFGKSLLLSTIQTYFEGKKELFHGLAIEKLEKNWSKHPVIHLELSRVRKDSHSSLQEILSQQLSLWEEKYYITDPHTGVGARFADIIIKAFKKTRQRVVVLIDEYDNPIINSMENKEVQNLNRDLLKSLYSNLKALDEYIRFGMLTGVSRFSKMSVFSGLNNLYDITLTDRYSTICGITRKEVEDNIKEGVEELGKVLNKDYKETCTDLARWYDGYHFSGNCPDIYNPFSLFNALENKKFSEYWFATGTPAFLIERLYEEKVDLQKYFDSEVSAPLLSSSDTSHESLLALLFQTGYLTIKQYDPEFDSYKLGIPNLEVKSGLFRDIMAVFQDKDKAAGFSLLKLLIKSLREGNPEEFIHLLKIYFASIPYRITHNSKELFFENNIYILLNLLGIYCQVETAMSSGRIDILIREKKFIYIIELKINKSAEEAMDQIEEKEYALPYQGRDKEIIKIGLNFSSQTRNISDYLISR